MEQEEHFRRLCEMDCGPQLTSIENTILALLQADSRLADTVIDVQRLHQICQASGLSTRQFSIGFVRLLTRRLLEPRGDFTFGLSAEGYTLGDAACLIRGGGKGVMMPAAARGGDEGENGI